MRHVADLEELVPTGRPNAEVEPAYKFVRKVRIAIHPISGNEFFEANQMTQRVTHRIMMRWIPEKVTPSHRLKMVDRVFNITSSVDVDEKHRLLSLMCLEAA
jgi:SPP1 family predicted phage head-tail adaptor